MALFADTYLALGDSRGVGVGASSGGGYVDRLFRRLQSMRPRARLVNLCQGGAATADVRDYQISRARKVRPVLVTLGVGIDDLASQVPEEAFAINLEEIAVALGSLRAPVVMLNIPDLALAPIAARVDRALYERRIEIFNEHIEATAARHHFTLIDLYAQSLSLRGRRELFSADGFHPSAEGYEELTMQIWPSVQARLSGRAAAQP
jgi:lysophospholipase L1-like esterase